MKERWPRLSETLPHPHPEECAACRDLGYDGDLVLWREHDDNDAPEMRFVVLCPKCSERLIESHARLYSATCSRAPAPGAMRICIDCVHRQRTRCLCPFAKANGGEGIVINSVKPTVYHIDRTVKGKRVGDWHVSYAMAPTACSGKQVEMPEPAKAP